MIEEGMDKKSKFIFYAAVFLLIVGIFLFFGSYFWLDEKLTSFGRPLLIDNAAEFGDYLSGVAGTLISAAAALLLVVTIQHAHAQMKSSQELSTQTIIFNEINNASRTMEFLIAEYRQITSDSLPIRFHLDHLIEMHLNEEPDIDERRQSLMELWEEENFDRESLKAKLSFLISLIETNEHFEYLTKEVAHSRYNPYRLIIFSNLNFEWLFSLYTYCLISRNKRCLDALAKNQFFLEDSVKTKYEKWELERISNSL